jgi:hypothetical protein
LSSEVTASITVEDRRYSGEQTPNASPEGSISYDLPADGMRCFL